MLFTSPPSPPPTFTPHRAIRHRLYHVVVYGAVVIAIAVAAAAAVQFERKMSPLKDFQCKNKKQNKKLGVSFILTGMLLKHYR